MTRLTSYTCAKCGGVLNVDIGQAVFECPFCGNGFDLSDFHRGEVLNEAALNLKNREFQSAQKKYGDLLAADENDILIAPFSEKEVFEAISQMKNNI